MNPSHMFYVFLSVTCPPQCLSQEAHDLKEAHDLSHWWPWLMVKASMMMKPKHTFNALLALDGITKILFSKYIWLKVFWVAIVIHSKPHQIWLKKWNEFRWWLAQVMAWCLWCKAITCCVIRLYWIDLLIPGQTACSYETQLWWKCILYIKFLIYSCVLYLNVFLRASMVLDIVWCQIGNKLLL